MPEYYRSEIRSVNHLERPSRRSLIMAVVDILIAALSVVVGVVMFITLFVDMIFPSWWLFPVLSLIAPATYVVTLLLALYWVIRWKLLRALPLALLLFIGLFSMGLFLKLEFKVSKHLEPKGRGVVKLMTYNVRQFYGPDGESSRDSLLMWVRSERPDIICFQEYNSVADRCKKHILDSLIGDEYNSTTGDTITYEAIYTRFKILRSGRTRGDIRGLKSIWADIVVGSDTLRLFNNHLNSTDIKSDDQEFLSADGFLQDTAREEKMRSILSRFSSNSYARAIQADTIAEQIKLSPYKSIVCGDFNDTPLSYTTARMRGKLKDAFREKGRGYSYTFNGFKNALRIDYVLLHRDLEVLYYDVRGVEYSDHYPVVVYFRRPDN